MQYVTRNTIGWFETGGCFFLDTVMGRISLQVSYIYMINIYICVCVCACEYTRILKKTEHIKSIAVFYIVRFMGHAFLPIRGSWNGCMKGENLQHLALLGVLPYTDSPQPMRCQKVMVSFTHRVVMLTPCSEINEIT